MTLSFHRFANLFPLIEGQEFYDLAEDIRANGLRDPIDLVQVGDDYQILDGRNRYRALVWLASTGEVLGGVDAWGAWHDGPLSAEKVANPRDRGLYSLYGGPADDEALAYVLSKNLSRRHLTDDQRRIVAADLVTMGKGRPGKMPQSAGFSREQAAAALATDVAGVERARTVVKRAVPEVVEAVKSGDLSVAAAAAIATQPVERQAEIAKALTRDASGKLTDEAKKALAPLIKEIRTDKIAAKKERRAEREAETGRRIQQLPGNFYGVAIEDFEWHHAAWSEATGSEKSPSMHYETAVDAQTPEAIVARCADRFACLAEDCIIFKWVTVPHLAIGIKVLELQGFRYVTSLVWNKERSGEARGPGYWFTGEHEVVLVGVRGKVVAPATAHFRSNFSAPVGGHSEKPDNLHEIVEFHWPTTPKVEFNARRRRDGWAAWGFDAPDVAPQGAIIIPTDAAPSPSSEGAVAAAVKLPANDDPTFLEWKALGAIDARVSVSGPAVQGLIKRGLVVVDIDDELVCTDEGLERLAELDQRFNPLPEASGETEAAAAETSDRASAAAAVADATAWVEVGFVHSGGRRESRYYLTAEEVADYSAAYWRRNTVCPPGHAIGMSLDPFHVTCSCGASFLFPDGQPVAMDSAIELHFIQVEVANTDLLERSASEPDRAPYDAGDTVVIDQLAGAEWLVGGDDAAHHPFDPASIGEREALKILSDFCHVKRSLAPALGEFYLARGFTYRGAVEWSLTGKGWDRLRELEAAELPAQPRVELTAPRRDPLTLFDVARQIDQAPAPETVDGALQTRLPVDDDELAEQLALLSIDADGAIEPQMLRHLVGKGFAHCGLTKISVTDDGRAFLAQLVGPVSVQQQGAQA